MTWSTCPSTPPAQARAPEAPKRTWMSSASRAGMGAVPSNLAPPEYAPPHGQPAVQGHADREQWGGGEQFRRNGEHRVAPRRPQPRAFPAAPGGLSPRLASEMAQHLTAAIETLAHAETAVEAHAALRGLRELEAAFVHKLTGPR